MAGNPLQDFEGRLNDCMNYLAESHNRKMLEPFLLKFLIVDVYSAYEKTIRNAIEQRAAMSGDKEFVQYLGMVAEKHHEPLGLMHPDKFIKEMKIRDVRLDNALVKNSNDTYDKLKKARNNVAHGEEPDISSLTELSRDHHTAKKIPLAFVDALRDRFN